MKLIKKVVAQEWEREVEGKDTIDRGADRRRHWELWLHLEWEWWVCREGWVLTVIGHCRRGGEGEECESNYKAYSWSISQRVRTGCQRDQACLSHAALSDRVRIISAHLQSHLVRAASTGSCVPCFTVDNGLFVYSVGTTGAGGKWERAVQSRKAVTWVNAVRSSGGHFTAVKWHECQRSRGQMIDLATVKCDVCDMVKVVGTKMMSNVLNWANLIAFIHHGPPILLQRHQTTGVRTR